MHLHSITVRPERFPTRERYPFSLEVIRQAGRIEFTTPVTFFVGENGSGKSTLLRAICRRCGIHIWEGGHRTRFEVNPYEEKLYLAVDAEWADGTVPGSFFAAEIFRNFSQLVDDWAASTPDVLQYFGGRSLITQSHGQSLLSFFRSRYQVKGLYLLDEPETALSPRSQVELLRLLDEMGRAGHAQFIVATHSPILLACPNSRLLDFDSVPIRETRYEDTSHYQVYKAFLENPEDFLPGQ